VSKQKVKLVVGMVAGHRDGYGFLSTDEDSTDIFISPKEMLKVMHGDKVAANLLFSRKNNKYEAVIQEVLEHSQRDLVGRLVLEKGIYVVIPEDNRIKHDILIPKTSTKDAFPDQVVMVKITDPPTKDTPPIGQIIEVIGGINDPGMEVKIAVRKFGIPESFPENILSLEANFQSPDENDIDAARQDLRDIDFFTVDGIDARDFDDAIYAEPIKGKSKGAWRLLVAIADVCHYVKSDDLLDKEAFNRGTSVYFPRTVIPMLPEYLSNNICSLVAGKDRFVLVCDMVVNSVGRIIAYQFYEAVIRSCARLTYDEYFVLLKNREQTRKISDDETLTPMFNAHEIFKLLLASRNSRGALDFETTETNIELTQDGKIKNISPLKRNDSHRIIEECMIAANSCAAEFLNKNGSGCLYRVHQSPESEKLDELRVFLKSQGIKLGGGEDPKPSDFSELLAKIKARVDADVLQSLILRTMQRAQYIPENSGHFALSLDYYTHFTSPIRRYPDLLVHRSIKSILVGKRYTPNCQFKDDDEPVDQKTSWKYIGEHCSNAERRADDASRDVLAWLKCQFMQDRVGEQMRGTITGVQPFGLFITLDDLFVEGLIHVSELGSEYFQFNSASYEMRGERTGKRYKLYDSVIVQLLRVDIDGRRIDFGLAPTILAKKKIGINSQRVSNHYQTKEAGRSLITQTSRLKNDRRKKSFSSSSKNKKSRVSDFNVRSLNQLNKKS
tara:strand:+ start:103739 stop:105916 length:2178 start_codon:yes stop_codon:yes gene_type:complete